MEKLKELIVFWKTLLEIRSYELTPYETDKILQTINLLEELQATKGGVQ